MATSVAAQDDGRPRAVVALAALMAAGFALRAAFALTTDGNVTDLQSFTLVRGWLHSDPLSLYSLATAGDIDRWPYLPGFLPGVLAADAVAQAGGWPFTEVLRLLLSAIDLLLVPLVYAALRGRLGERRALAGAACAALAPTFVAVSGHHGQLDVVAWVPAAAALVAWDGRTRRVVLAGLLVGLAISIKSVAGLMLLALLPSARDRREALVLAGAAAAVPLALSAPWLVADTGGLLESLRHHGVWGLGGVSMLAQPELATFWLSANYTLTQSSLEQVVQDLAGPAVVVAVLGTAAVLHRRRTPAPEAAVALLMAFYVAGVNFVPPWAAWGLVVLLVAGRLRAAVALQALLLAPTLLYYLAPKGRGWSETLVYAVYVPCTAAFWVVCLVAWIGVLRGDVRLPVRGPARLAADQGSP